MLVGIKFVEHVNDVANLSDYYGSVIIDVYFESSSLEIRLEGGAGFSFGITLFAMITIGSSKVKSSPCLAASLLN